MRHLPLLRAGSPYKSLDVATLKDVRTGEPIAEVSQAAPFHIARDLRDPAALRRSLEERSVGELLEICRKAGKLFGEAELEIGGEPQTPDDYIRDLSATTGMPQSLGRSNMDKITGVLAGIEGVLDGLTRGLDLSVLDGGWGKQDGRALSYLRRTDTLGAVLPNNSPGVHNLWVPAIPLKTALVLRPGSAEPWTPYRLAQAFLDAGCPPEAFSLYPSSHAGATEILLRTGRAMFFGDTSTVRGWQGSDKVQVHGPGWSKVLFGADAAPHWADHLDLLASSVAANGGRSCINCSSVWIDPAHARDCADALARELAKIEARALDDPRAALAAFPDPEVARRISQMVDDHLDAAGAEDLTAKYRDGGRVAEAGGCTFLLPTVIYCEDKKHPLAEMEFIFPFVAVVAAEPETVLDDIGPTLIGTLITEDPATVQRGLACRRIDRLNLGAIPTFKISWDQPHEGNLFEHLFHQRAFQNALAS